jgi:hypothetical protein
MQSKAIECWQYYLKPGIPDGMDRSFPFFLDSRQSVASQTALANEHSVMEIDNIVSKCKLHDISTCRFDVEIPTNELCIEEVRLHFNQIGISSCSADLEKNSEKLHSSNRNDHRRGISKFQTKSIEKVRLHVMIVYKNQSLSASDYDFMGFHLLNESIL